MARFSKYNPLVYTVKNKCRVCYTCVRECPVKAIKMINGQADVIQDRCIACGNCVKVCSQDAKVFFQSIDLIQELINSDSKTIACVAPSFPAEFTELNDYKIFVGMLKKLGFDIVTEVAFGADLVAKEYEKVFNDNNSEPIITSDCPAIVNYISHYHPNLVETLAKIDSPAMAMAKVVRKKYGEDCKLVFIGPCVAKKSESDSFDEVLTFTELREMFGKNYITPDSVKPLEFDGPISAKGAIFPINHGLLQSLDKSEGLGKGKVVTAEGKTKFKEAVTEFEDGQISNQHIELLCCDGCIQGAGMTEKGKIFSKRMKVSEYVENKMQCIDIDKFNNYFEEFSKFDLSREFEAVDRRNPEPKKEEIDLVLKSMGKNELKDMLNCGACGYETCFEHAVAVTEGLAESEMCLPFTIEKLHKSIEDINLSNDQLDNARKALKQSEKLASMGQVSAGIAHELNNPLGIITLYSSILKEEIDNKSDMFEDINIINEQAERCKNIVGGLLNFARKNRLRLTKCNIVEFIENSFNSVIKPDNVDIQFISNIDKLYIDLDATQMMQVLTNIEKNAIEAMPEGGTLKIELNQINKEIEINISDTGSGISEENIEKIFTPFFTTKPAGKGTGLGLPLVYGIIKMHKGKISVKSNSDSTKGETGTTFNIILPITVL